MNSINVYRMHIPARLLHSSELLVIDGYAHILAGVETTGDRVRVEIKRPRNGSPRYVTFPAEAIVEVEVI